MAETRKSQRIAQKSLNGRSSGADYHYHSGLDTVAEKKGLRIISREYQYSKPKQKFKNCSKSSVHFSKQTTERTTDMRIPICSTNSTAVKRDIVSRSFELLPTAESLSSPLMKYNKTAEKLEKCEKQNHCSFPCTTYRYSEPTSSSNIWFGKSQLPNIYPNYFKQQLNVHSSIGQHEEDDIYLDANRNEDNLNKSPSMSLSLPESLNDFVDSDDLRQLLAINAKKVYHFDEARIKLLSIILNVEEDHLARICYCVNEVSAVTLRKLTLLLTPSTKC